jgi:hypothetical protein
MARAILVFKEDGRGLTCAEPRIITWLDLDQSASVLHIRTTHKHLWQLSQIDVSSV